MEFGGEYSSAIGCNDSQIDPAARLQCLRSLPTAHLMTTLVSELLPNWPYTDPTKRPYYMPPMAPFVPWSPVLDGSIAGIPKEPYVMLKEQGSVPLLIGSNRNEGTEFEPAIALVSKGNWPVTTAEKFNNVLLQLYKNQTVVDMIAKFYDAEPDMKTYDGEMARIIRDACFTCATRRVVRVLSDHNVSTYLYNWDFLLPDGDLHGGETKYVFDVLKNPSKREMIMADIFGAYWTDFVKFGVPGQGHSELPVWPAYTTSNDLALMLTTEPVTKSGIYKTNCDLWDEIYDMIYPTIM